MDILLRDLRLKPGGLRLGDLHAVQRTDNLDVTLCEENMKPSAGLN